MHNTTIALMTGAGIGVDYSELRPEGKLIRKTGGMASGPSGLVNMVNESARWIMQGGYRRAALWAGLNWKHQDVIKFIHLKDWSPEIRALKAKDYNFPAALDLTNISVQLDDEFFEAFHDEKHVSHSHAQMIYWEVIKRMMKTGEPGFSVDVKENAEETLRNACTEVTSKDDSDICNLGSINLARVENLEEMKDLVTLGSLFLLAGTVYSDVPYTKVDRVRTKNRRIGLGLLGVHEWLLLHGKHYGPDADLQKYLEVYEQSTSIVRKLANEYDLSKPLKSRAIAPTGTIGILAESTTGLEPIFCAAYKRRYKKGLNLDNYQYVLDPTAKRLVESGINPDNIEDAYTIAQNVERRVAFQAWMQQYVDHAISSTINLPAWGTELNNENKVKEFGNMLINYLPKLRGITVYPDGARDGQPLTPVKYNEAAKFEGQVFVEQVDVCELGKGGSCGS
jgi:ribonucleoside-diphosphate reductase alpha chain